MRHPLNRSRRVAGFHTTSALKELLARDFEGACEAALRLPHDHPRLRPYQKDANAAVEKAIAERKRNLLVAMATGTGRNSSRKPINSIPPAMPKIPEMNEVTTATTARAASTGSVNIAVRRSARGRGCRGPDKVRAMSDTDLLFTPAAKAAALIRDRAAAQLLGVFATDTALVLAHSDIDEKSNEIPAAQALLAELGLAGRLVTLDALHCQSAHSKPPPRPDAT